MRSRSAVIGLIAVFALAACSGDSPYVVVSGGGILFNYRIAEATAGIVAEVARPLPEGGTVEASFEMPMRLSLSPFALAFNQNDRIQGRAEGGIDLALIAPLLPLDEDTVKGQMRIEGTLGGTLSSPDLQGRAVLAEHLRDRRGRVRGERRVGDNGACQHIGRERARPRRQNRHTLERAKTLDFTRARLSCLGCRGHRHGERQRQADTDWS